MKTYLYTKNVPEGGNADLFDFKFQSAACIVRRCRRHLNLQSSLLLFQARNRCPR